jgi:fimbrial chaperone protein
MGEPTSPGRVRALVAVASVVLGLACTAPSLAAGFSVNPLRIYLHAGHMTETIQVRNDEESALSLQLRAYAWSQDERGKDLYDATDELIFFPKLLTLEPGEQRMVRVGVRGLPPEGEQGYRIYLEELPDATPVPSGRLRTLLRVGVPVFRQPSQLEHVGEVVNVELDGCEASFSFANRGNAHLMLKSVAVRALDAAGDELDSGELRGWYVLAGRERPYRYAIPEEACAATSRLEVHVESDQGSFVGVVDDPS